MPHQPAAPSEADALRPLAQAIAHARIPAALKLLLLALLGAVSLAEYAARPLRRPRKDWYPSPQAETADHPDSVLDSRAPRAYRRLRAWIGWILRCLPGLGMALSGKRALPPRPSRAARAPPRAACGPIHPESVAKTPRPAATTHAQIPAPENAGLLRAYPSISCTAPLASRRS